MATPITLPDFNTNSGETEQTNEPGSEVEIDPELSIESIASPFLKNIPDQDKAIVAKYIKGWDSGVTKKIQGIHDKYKPWEELGDIDVVKRSLEIVTLLQKNPKDFHKNLTAYIAQLEGNEMPNEFEDTEEVGEEYDDPRDAQIAQLTKHVEELTGAFTSDVQSRKEQQEIAALDRELENLHTKHGDFDEDWVLVQVTRGTPIEDAIKMFNDKYGQRVSSQKNTPPKILSGAGNRDSGGQADPSKMSAEDRKKYVASVLEAAANS